MKVVCDFCKTEYDMPVVPNSALRCVVCGNVWTPKNTTHNKSAIKFFAALTAFVAACVFAFVVLFNNGDKKGLVTQIDEKNVHLVTDKNGNNRIFVSGDITNTSEEIYGLPNIVIISYDANDTVLSRQSFVPPVTFLEPKTTVTFNYVLSVSPTNVKRLDVELKGIK